MMTVNLKKITFSDLKDIYYNYMINDFIKEELKSLKEIKNLYLSKSYIGYVLEDDSNVLGYVLLYILDNDILIDYLATVDGFRNKGYGSILLESVIKKYKDKNLIIEVENPQYAINNEAKNQMKRRISFYSKKNFIKTDINVYLFDVYFNIMVRNKLEKDELIKKLNNIYKVMYPLKDYDKNVRIF